MKPGNVFIDIDGVLLNHLHQLKNVLLQGKFHLNKNGESEGVEEQYLLPNVHEQLEKWRSSGNCIILTTARTENMRKFTEKQLEKHGIVYDSLICGLNSGLRVLLNDTKPGFKNPDGTSKPTAMGKTIERDRGLVMLDDVDDFLAGKDKPIVKQTKLGEDEVKVAREILEEEQE